MNLSDTFRFLKEILQTNAEVLAAFFTGAVFAAMLIYFFRRWLIRSSESTDLAVLRNQHQAELAKSETLNRMVKEKETRIHELSRDCEDLKEQLNETEAARQKLLARMQAGRERFEIWRHQYQRIKQERDSLLSRDREVEEANGRIWEKPPKVAVAPFRELCERRVPIISLFNLKGGVGKTSITAHLGAALWKAGKRVLLVDLDYQASLSHLALPLHQIEHHKVAQKFVQRIWNSNGHPGQAACELLAQATVAGSYVLSAHEDLARVEEEKKANWLLHPTDEPRYALRAALHDPLFEEKFDYILLDCPPRLSMACVNALTASDFLLVPTLFDKTSRDAVTRLLALVNHLSAQGVCPELQVLGIVGNKAFRFKTLTRREKNAWSSLRAQVKDMPNGRAATFFRCHLPQAKAFAEASETGELADRRADLGPMFADLASELEKEINKRVAKNASSLRSSKAS